MSDQLIAEITGGEGLTLRQAAKLLPSYREGQPLNVSTLFRWTSKGLLLEGGTRIQLEAMRFAGRLLTSRPALARFLVAQQQPYAQAAEAVLRTPSTRQRECAQASEALATEFAM